MARQARKRSKTGIYHVMLRGNERKAVFPEQEDKEKFIQIALKKREMAGSYLYAYCVMDNHVHMVIQELENGQPLEILMKRIGVSYAAYFNTKYKRVGHVFQDRFRSEAIEDEAQLLSVIRYVHQNPVKAGMETRLDYAWSSYQWYRGAQKGAALLPEMELLLAMLSEHKKNAVKSFTSFHAQEEMLAFSDVEQDREGNEDAQSIIEKFLLQHGVGVQQLKMQEYRDLAVKLVKKLAVATGLSGRQVAALIGLNRELVRKMLCH